MTAQTLRYQLPKKSIKGDCPQCGLKHRKTLSRYIDTRTDELLPEDFGRCDRESNCGYHRSPYHKTASGMSYADEQKQPPIPKEWFRIAGKQKRNDLSSKSIVQYLRETRGATSEQAERVAKIVFDEPTHSAQLTPPEIEYVLPNEVFNQSLGHYDHNQFARLLIRQFGQSKADELLQRFQIGTSSYWQGACVFWLIDQQQHVRAGQVVLFADDWHKAKYTDKEGNRKQCISSVSHALLRRYRQQQQTPDWFTVYQKNAPCWPILFGLHQLSAAPINQRVAIVEAPKTAVVCSALIPGFVWLAVGGLSYLNAERLAPLRGRSIMLYPDLSKDGKAFTLWSKVADDLNAKGYQISVSDFLERGATDEQKEQGLDLADFLLNTPVIVRTVAEQLARPGSILKPDESQIERGEISPMRYLPG